MAAMNEVELMFLHIKTSWLRLLTHIARMPPWGGVLPYPAERKPHGRICWRDYISQLVWEHFSILPEVLKEVARERELWV